MSSYKEAVHVYSLPQPGEKRPKKKVTKKLSGTNVAIENVNEKNSHLDIYFEIQRREHVAATRIKRCWKKSRVLIPWRKAAYALLGIVKIQAHARGMIARRYIAMWYKLRTEVIIETQARVRKLLSNIHIRPILKYEDNMVRKIQPIVRGWLGRRRWHRILCDLCATRIQALWRGVTDRARADKRWLHSTVIPIQKCVRSMIARRKCNELKKVLTHAVVTIQRRYRLYLATTKISKRLFNREMQYRLNIIDMLTAEEDLCNEKVQRIMDRVVKLQIKEKVDQSLKKVTESEQEIFMKENSLIEITKQYEQLSPRAIKQGFREELSKRKDELRNALSQLKRKHIFELSREMLNNEGTFEGQVKELEEWASRSKKISRWRLDEYDERRHLTYEQDINERRREQRFLAADERRRWQVYYYTNDGKPDKKRRPGRPWDKSIFAGAEKATYNSAGIDLLALNKPINNRKGKELGGRGGGKDLTDSAEQTIQQVSLKVYIDQMRVYEEIMDPIARIMQQYMGLLPHKDGKVKRLDEQGWGPVGRDVDKAMRGIGMHEIDANTRERIIGGFSKDNILFQQEHDQITRRGVAKKPQPAWGTTGGSSVNGSTNVRSGANSVKGGGSAITSRKNSSAGIAGIGAMIPWTGGAQPNPSQPAGDSNDGEPTGEKKSNAEDFFTSDDGVQSVDSYSTASLDPGSTFPQQQSNLLRNNSLHQNSSFNMRNGRAVTNPNGKNNSFSTQRSKLSESRERDRMINTATTSTLANAGTMVLAPPSSSHSPSRTVSRAQSKGGSHMKLSAMFEADGDEEDADNDHMSAITEATDELASETGDGVSAEEVYKSLRRCWKKPMKPYLPTMESFASLYTDQQQAQQEEAAARAAAKGHSSWDNDSSTSGYSMSTGMLSKSSPNFFKEDKDFIAFQHEQQKQEKEKRKQEKKKLQREQEAMLQKNKGSDDIGVEIGDASGGKGDKAKSNDKKPSGSSKAKGKGLSDLFSNAGSKNGLGDGEDDVFFREDLVTVQQKKIEENKIIRDQMHESRRAKKKKIYGNNKTASVIPWNLLDDVDGAKTRLESEIAHIEYNHRF